jgi:tRNA G10  N-methylase Trm11
MSSLNYIAILGRQPELGLVELESVLGSSAVAPFGRQAAVLDEAIEIGRFGGVMKVGEIMYRGPLASLQALPVMVDALPMNESKTPFGLSGYGLRDSAASFRAAGLSLKKLLRARGSVRLIVPAKGMALSAAELTHNRVLELGFELLIVATKSEMIIARTTGVQDIDWYSKRDYERPSRSAKVGMLPPKLAQVLVNSVAAGAVFDPFCGTGVVLQEALLMGRVARGSDLAPEMVAATQDNLTWLQGMTAQPVADWAVAEADARTVKLPAGVAVVSEGYLGTNQEEPPSQKALKVLRTELMALYREALRNFAAQLPAGGEVSICAPAWRVGGTWHYLGLVDELADLGYTLKGFKHVRTPLLYARDDQIVGRQLLLLRKN